MTRGMGDQGDGWLNRGWEAKWGMGFVEISGGDGWPAGEWVAKLVARLFVTASSLGLNPDISQKIINERHKQRSGKHTIARQRILLNPSYS